jgi:hypothetical protein
MCSYQTGWKVTKWDLNGFGVVKNQTLNERCRSDGIGEQF